MKKAREKTKRSLKELFCVRYDIPPDVFSGDIVMTLSGRNRLTVTGKTKILLYSPEKIIFGADKAVIAVKGVRLSPTVYHPDILLIDGYIDGVEYTGGHEGEGKSEK